MDEWIAPGVGSGWKPDTHTRFLLKLSDWSANAGRRYENPTILHRRDVANPIEGAVSGTVVAKRKPAIGVIDNGDPLADRHLGWLARLQDEDRKP